MNREFEDEDVGGSEQPVGWLAWKCLSAFTADTTSQLDVLGHDRHSLGVDGAQVDVLKQTDQVSLARLLQSHHGRALEAQISLEVLCNLTHQALERQLADQQLGRLLVATDLTKCHSCLLYTSPSPRD